MKAPRGAPLLINVRFFASLREAVNRDAVCVELDDATLGGVRAQLAALLDATQLEAISAGGVQVAVNQAIVRGEVALAAGDEVAFLPPVTGG